MTSAPPGYLRYMHHASLDELSLCTVANKIFAIDRLLQWLGSKPSEQLWRAFWPVEMGLASSQSS